MKIISGNETGLCATQQAQDLKAHIEETILREFGCGPLIGGEALWRSLGYPTIGAFRKADARGLLPIPVFTIDRRLGKYALVTDIASWLVELRDNKQSERKFSKR